MCCGRMGPTPCLRAPIGRACFFEWMRSCRLAMLSSCYSCVGTLGSLPALPRVRPSAVKSMSGNGSVWALPPCAYGTSLSTRFGHIRTLKYNDLITLGCVHGELCGIRTDDFYGAITFLHSDNVCPLATVTGGCPYGGTSVGAVTFGVMTTWTVPRPL